MTKDLHYYKRLRWKRAVRRVDDETGRYWQAYYTDLADVVGTGETREDAVLMHAEMFDEYVQMRLDMGLPVPAPADAKARKKGSRPKAKLHSTSDTSSNSDRVVGKSADHEPWSTSETLYWAPVTST